MQWIEQCKYVSCCAAFDMPFTRNLSFYISRSTFVLLIMDVLFPILSPDPFIKNPLQKEPSDGLYKSGN